MASQNFSFLLQVVYKSKQAVSDNFIQKPSRNDNSLFYYLLLISSLGYIILLIFQTFEYNLSHDF